MLVLTRKIGEKIIIGGNITITLLSRKSERIRLGLEAPGDVKVVRAELLETQETLGPIKHAADAGPAALS